jgi:hypothetical protein
MVNGQWSMDSRSSVAQGAFFHIYFHAPTDEFVDCEFFFRGYFTFVHSIVTGVFNRMV